MAPSTPVPPPRQPWQMAWARASAASAGEGGAFRPRMRATMAPTWDLSALPEPVTAALASLGVCCATSRPALAPATMATPMTWATEMTERRLSWAKTRSTDTEVGPRRAIQSSRARAMVSSRSSGLWEGGVRTTPTSTRRTRRRGSMSTHPSPQRVSPGSTPMTRCWATRACPEAGLGGTTPGTGRRERAGGPHSSGSSWAATSAEMSTEVKTFWTSSESSRASTRRRTLRAPSASTSTLVPATNWTSADS